MKGLSILDVAELGREKWRVIEEALSEVYMQGWLGTGTGTRLGGAADGVLNFGYTGFPDAVTSSSRYELKVRQRWHGCGIRVTAWYTAPAGSTATFNLTLVARQTREGQNILTPLALFSQAFTAAGPAVAQDVKKWQYTSATGLISAHYDILSLIFVRDGADANNGEYRQILAHYEILEPS